MALLVFRFVFLLVAAGLATLFINSKTMPQEPAWLPWAVFAGIMCLALSVIGIDSLIPRKRIDTISAVYFGILVGLFLTYVLGIALTPLISATLQDPIQLLLGMVLCYVCVSVLIQTKDDFRFVIPYVEFSKEVKGLHPFILDTSVVIDGRIADFVETQVIDNPLIMPRFVLTELQAIADSGDKLRRAPRPPLPLSPRSAPQLEVDRSANRRPRTAGNGGPIGRYEAGDPRPAPRREARHRRL